MWQKTTKTLRSYLQQGFRGVVFRSVTGPALVECVRRVAAGDTWLPTQVAQPESPEEDLVGARVRDRLTPKEMRIVALIVQGCKNREIAMRLKTTEQVIKNYLRSIYDKTGVGDRLELAFFTIHHRVLAAPRRKWATRWKPKRRPHREQWRRQTRGCLIAWRNPVFTRDRAVDAAASVRSLMSSA